VQPLVGPRESRSVRWNQEREARSSGAACIGAALLPDPSCRVGIPVMILICKGAGGGLDIAPAKLLTNGTLDCRTDESAAPPGSAQLVDLSDKLIVEFNVHSHV
jgi:hypothetical protein